MRPTQYVKTYFFGNENSVLTKTNVSSTIISNIVTTQPKTHFYFTRYTQVQMCDFNPTK